MTAHDGSQIPATFEKGQHFICASCGAEVEILSPGNGKAPHLELRCCGRPMVATVGRDINLGDE